MMQSTIPTAPPPLRVMTFNIRYGTAKDGENDWSHRREILFRAIERNDPDLLGTQEALAMQVKQLKERFPGYGFVGVGRDDGKEAGEFAGLFFRSARFELVDQGHFWLSEHPEKPGSVSWDSALTRMATWVKLRDKSDGGREFLFLNTHWDHRGEKARLESAKLIRSRMRELAAGLPCIITADLNAEEETPEYRELIGADLIDAYRVVQPQRSTEEATFHEFKGARKGNRIDFVLTTRVFAPVDARIDRTEEGGHFPSDHFPVVVEVKRM
ncbi:MAG TPA: endonuclease/exonuclease/phosphatase family protein [Tepidisphaeraceae bacterium]